MASVFPPRQGIWWHWQPDNPRKEAVILLFGGEANWAGFYSSDPREFKKLEKGGHALINPVLFDPEYTLEKEQFITDLQQGGFDVYSNNAHYAYYDEDYPTSDKESSPLGPPPSTAIRDLCNELKNLGYKVHLFGFSAGGTVIGYEVLRNPGICDSAVIANGLLNVDTYKVENDFDGLIPLLSSADNAWKNKTPTLLISSVEDQLTRSSMLHYKQEMSQSEVFHHMGDVNYDGNINQADSDLISGSFDAFKGDANYRKDLDLNVDWIINMRDLAIASRNQGRTLGETPVTSSSWIDWENGHDVFPNKSVDGESLAVTTLRWLHPHPEEMPQPTPKKTVFDTLWTGFEVFSKTFHLPVLPKPASPPPLPFER